MVNVVQPNTTIISGVPSNVPKPPSNQKLPLFCGNIPKPPTINLPLPPVGNNIIPIAPPVKIGSGNSAVPKAPPVVFNGPKKKVEKKIDAKKTEEKEIKKPEVVNNK